VAVLLGTILVVALPIDLSAEWRQLDVEAFRIIFQEDDSEVAAEVAELAPHVYASVSELLDYRPDGPIPVVIYGDTATANGYFTPYPPHIALYVASPVGPWIGARTESWIEAVFIHELTHYLHLTRPVGLFGAPSRVFGPLLASASAVFMPGWMIEGPTVYAETEFTSGGRGRNPFFEMQWTAPLLADEMYSYDQAGTYSPFPPSGRIYSSGYMIVDHLTDRYGSDSVRRLNREFQRAPILGMRRAIRRTFDISAEELYAELIYSLENENEFRRALPDGASFAPDEIGEWRLVAAREDGVYAYAWSTRRRGALVFRTWTDDRWHEIVPVAPVNADSIDVSADGTTAVATIREVDFDGAGATTGYSDLYRIDLESGDDHRLTRGTRLYHPRIGPDGTIYALERVGSYARLVQLSDDSIVPRYEPPERSLYTPAISPDGALIAVVENDRGDQDIVILETETFEPVVRIGAPGRSAEYYPAFISGSSGLEVWFGSDRDGDLALYHAPVPDQRSHGSARVERIGGEHLFTDRIAAFAGAPDPDRTGFVYASYRAHGYTIRRAEFPGGARETGTDSGTAAVRDDVPGPGRYRGADSDLIHETVRYRDALRPVLWFPVASLSGGTDRNTDLDVGALFLAASTLARHELQAIVFYNPWAFQPGGQLSYTFTPRASSWTISAGQDYQTDARADTEVTTTESDLALAWSRPLWYSRGLDVERGLIASVESVYSSASLTTDRASFVDTIASQSTHWRQDLSVGAAARLFRRRFGAGRDVFGGPMREIRTSASYTPALLDVERDELSTVHAADVRFRLWRSSPIQIQPSIGIATDTAGGAVDRLPYIASRFSENDRSAITDAETATLGRVQLLVPLGLYDGAWRGAAFHRLGASLYVEQEAVVADASVRAGSFFTTGFELTTDVAFNTIPIRFRAGVVARIDHDPDSGNNDVRFYVALGDIGGLRVGSPEYRTSAR
jgi:hypothetical protein